MGIEDGVIRQVQRTLNALNRKDEDKAAVSGIEFDENLLGGPDGWARHEASFKCLGSDAEEPGLLLAPASLGREAGREASEACIAAVMAEHRSRVPWEHASKQMAMSRGDGVQRPPHGQSDRRRGITDATVSYTHLTLPTT